MSNYSINVPCNCTECISIFENGFKLTEHLIKIHQRSIDVLPPHMVDQILEYVSPSDLAALNQLSHKLKCATEEHVKDKRRHCGAVIIVRYNRNFRDEKILILPNSVSNYDKIFMFLIPNISIKFSNEVEDDHTVSKVFEFIRKKCPQQLRSLEICNYLGSSNVIHDNEIKIIAEQIKHVQILKLGQGVYSAFQFQHFCNLQALFIGYLETNVNSTFWNQKLPKLKILSVCGEEDDYVDLKQFLKNNNQLKLFHDANFKSLSALLSIEDSLPYVSFQVDDITFDESGTDFVECCNRKLIILFVDIAIMGIKNELLQLLLQLTNVKILHFAVDACLTFNQDINIQPHIEQLCLDFEIPISMAEITTIFSCFPNLSVMRLLFIEKSNNISHQEMIAALVINLPKLKHIYYCHGFEFDNQMWDHLRSNAKNESIVTIHLKKRKKSFPESGIKIYSLQGKSAAVKFEDIVRCPKCLLSQDNDAMLDYFNGLISK